MRAENSIRTNALEPLRLARSLAQAASTSRASTLRGACKGSPRVRQGDARPHRTPRGDAEPATGPRRGSGAPARRVPLHRGSRAEDAARGPCSCIFGIPRSIPDLDPGWRKRSPGPVVAKTRSVSKTRADRYQGGRLHPSIHQRKSRPPRPAYFRAISVDQFSDRRLDHFHGGGTNADQAPIRSVAVECRDAARGRCGRLTWGRARCFWWWKDGECAEVPRVIRRTGRPTFDEAFLP